MNRFGKLPRILLAIPMALSSITSIQACPLELPRVTLSVQDILIQAEIADDEPEKRCGLSNRHYLENNHGMLFVYTRPHILRFWMKDTHIPLSIAFLNVHGEILEILRMPETNSQKIYTSQLPTRFALEMPLGWFETNNIKPGNRVLHLPANPE